MQDMYVPFPSWGTIKQKMGVYGGGSMQRRDTSFWCETSARDFRRYRSTQGVDSVAELILNGIEGRSRLGCALTIRIYCVQAVVSVRRLCQYGKYDHCRERALVCRKNCFRPTTDRTYCNKKCAKRLRWRAFRAIYFSATRM
jgi:hypothetical protein